MNGYTIRKLPRAWAKRYGPRRHCEWAIFSPAGQIIASSWCARLLWRLCEQLNDAYQLGVVTGRLAKRGRPAKLDPAGESHLTYVGRLKEWRRF